MPKCCNPECTTCNTKCYVPHCLKCYPLLKHPHMEWARSDYTTRNHGIIRCPIGACAGLMISIHGYIGQCYNSHLVQTYGNTLTLKHPQSPNPDTHNKQILKHFHDNRESLD